MTEQPKNLEDKPSIFLNIVCALVPVFGFFGAGLTQAFGGSRQVAYVLFRYDYVLYLGSVIIAGIAYMLSGSRRSQAAAESTIIGFGLAFLSAVAIGYIFSKQ